MPGTHCLIQNSNLVKQHTNPGKNIEQICGDQWGEIND